MGGRNSTVAILVACALGATACSAKDRTSDSQGTGSAAGTEPCEGFDDGNACTIDTCGGTTAVHTPIPTIDDNYPCTIDECDPVTAEITHTLKTIDDGNACTADYCDEATGEVHHNEIQPGWWCGSCPAGWHSIEQKDNDCGGPGTLYYLCAITC